MKLTLKNLPNLKYGKQDYDVLEYIEKPQNFYNRLNTKIQDSPDILIDAKFNIFNNTASYALYSGYFNADTAMHALQKMQ